MSQVLDTYYFAHVSIFLRTKLRKSMQNALGNMEEMMAEGENVKLGFMF